MIPLDLTTRKLQAFLGGAAATTNPTVTVSYYDVPKGLQKSDYSDYPRTPVFTVLAGVTETDICSAPNAGVTRHIDYINIYNTDSASVDCFVVVDDNGTNRIQVKITLATTESAVWTPASGWKIVT
jgi:hypothetical protein